MKVYNFDPATFEYVGSSEADASPLEPEVLLLPANATFLVPPLPADDKKIVFQAGAWVLIDAPPPTLPVVAPEIIVTPWRFRKALNAEGLRSAVEAAIAAADQDTRDGYEFATEFRRHDPLVVTMGAALGKTSAQMDDFFTLAATL